MILNYRSTISLLFFLISPLAFAQNKFTISVKGITICEINKNCIYSAKDSRSERQYCPQPADKISNDIIYKNCGIEKNWDLELFEAKKFGINKIKKIIKVRAISPDPK